MPIPGLSAGTVPSADPWKCLIRRVNRAVCGEPANRTFLSDRALTSVRPLCATEQASAADRWPESPHFWSRSARSWPRSRSLPRRPRRRNSAVFSTTIRRRGHPAACPGSRRSRRPWAIRGSLPPPPQYQQPAPPQQVSRPPQSNIQARPLAPPPGATSAPPPQQASVPPRPLPAPANPPPPEPADTSPQSDDTVVTYTPTQKIENQRAIFSGLDKITGRIISFDAAIGETVQFGALQVTARACNTRPPTEPTNTDAFVEVDEVTLQGEIKRIFTGWMFSAISRPACGRASDLRRVADGLRATGRRRGRAIGAAASRRRHAGGGRDAGQGASGAAESPAATVFGARASHRRLIATFSLLTLGPSRQRLARLFRTVSPDTGRSVGSAAKSASPTSAASSSL